MKKFICLIFALLISSNAYAISTTETRSGIRINAERKIPAKSADIYKAYVFRYDYRKSLEYGGPTLASSTEGICLEIPEDAKTVAYRGILIAKPENEVKYTTISPDVRKASWSETEENVDVEDCKNESVARREIGRLHTIGYRQIRAKYDSETFSCKKDIVDICFESPITAGTFGWKTNPKILEKQIKEDGFLDTIVTDDVFKDWNFKSSLDELQRDIGIPLEDILSISSFKEINWDAVKKGL